MFAGMGGEVNTGIEKSKVGNIGTNYSKSKLNVSLDSAFFFF